MFLPPAIPPQCQQDVQLSPPDMSMQVLVVGGGLGAVSGILVLVLGFIIAGMIMRCWNPQVFRKKIRFSNHKKMENTAIPTGDSHRHMSIAMFSLFL